MNLQIDWLRSSTFIGGHWQGALACLIIVLLLGCGTPPPEDSNQTKPSEQKPAAEKPASVDNASIPEGPRFDWGKFTNAGDVTQEVLPYFVNHQIDFGTRKITTSQAVKLAKAEVVQGKLLLTFQMTQPKQSVQFEGFDRELGSYRPHRKPPRSVSMRGASHKETFVFGGVLYVGVPHPQPDKILVAEVKPFSLREAQKELYKEIEENDKARRAEYARLAAERALAQKSAPKPKPQTLMPGPESGYKPRSLEFAQLAVGVSSMYKMPDRNTFRPFEKGAWDAAQAAVAYPDPDVQEEGNKILKLIKNYQSIDVHAIRRDMIQDAEAIEARIDRGDYIRTESETVDDFSGGFIRTRRYDDSGLARSEAANLRSLARLSDAELLKYARKQFDLPTKLQLNSQGLVHYAYKALREDAKKAAGAKSDKCLISLSRPDSRTPHLLNISGKFLTDVVVDLSWGMTRSDKIKKFGHGQFVFIPIWKPGEEVELQKFDLPKPMVFHAKVNVYANEASSEDHEFSMIDPQNPPSTEPGKIVIYRSGGLAAFGRPPFQGTAWALIDGKRVDWDVNVTHGHLIVSAEPGEHKVVVHVRERRKRPQVPFDGTVTVDREDREAVEVKF